MLNIEVLKNEKYGRLRVASELEKENNKRVMLCICDCGNIKKTLLTSLRTGKVKSCGCLNRELTKERSLKHGLTGTRLYEIWQGIKKRCLNEKCKAYNDYGGRGLKIYEPWINEFKLFYDWALLNGYNKDLSIDRINNNIGYYPDNCKFSTREEQNTNKRNTLTKDTVNLIRNIKLNNPSVTQLEISKRFNINKSTINQIIKKVSYYAF